tara:strand:+ start:5547 stop:7247 length:1701 start_codon:yes stop_codon:yes gene_type:complete
MNIFIAQINPIVGDLRGNSKKILNNSIKAIDCDADLVLTPELSLWGYPPKDLLLQDHLIEQQSIILDELSKEIAKANYNLSVLVGIAEKTKDNFFPDLFNSIALIEKGKWSVIARKIILPTYEVFDEKRYFRSEKKVSVFEKKLNSKKWKMGITICEDLWVNQDIQGRGIHKMNPIFDLKREKIDLLINLSASPFTFRKFENRLNISSSAANFLNVPIFYVNQIGGNDDLIFDGNSFILNKNGQIIKRLKSCKEDFFCWKSNKNLNFNNIRNYISLESTFDALVLGVKDYARKCGFNSALIGLSGGIDSALVSVIATAALGSKNIYSIAMPSKWNNISSKQDAQELSQRLDINFKTMPINDLLNVFELGFANYLNLKLEGIAYENIQSRIRGTLLMALANQNNHLLLSTGNKSELAVGYCTLYGDMNGGLSVIGDLYKTNVFKLCKWLDSDYSLKSRAGYSLPIQGKLIGDKIYNKSPSAELGPNQLDTDSLPPYSELDVLLKSIIEEKQDIKELLDNGHRKDLLFRVFQLIKKAEFKRKQAPPILKLSSQSLGNDWRIPIAISNN